MLKKAFEPIKTFKIERKSKCYIFLFFTVILIITFLSFKASEKDVMHTYALKKENINMIIDPGHGGFDNGATSNNVDEKHINLQISLKLKELFISNGFNVIMTRETDDSIESETLEKGINKKKSDMKNRLKILNGDSNNIFISVHQNKYFESSSKGAQIFYGPNNERSESLAQYVQESFVQELQPDNKREKVKAKSNLFLLYKATVPAILVECGFLSNPSDLENLQDSEYQDKVCDAIFKGVEKFIYEE